MMGIKTVAGCDLKPGDVLHVWWNPGRDTIISMKPYTGPLDCFEQGASIAYFAVNKTGMTLAHAHAYEVVVPDDA